MTGTSTLASSRSGFIAGTVYDTVTVSPAPTGKARVRVTSASSTETAVTARESPSTVTVNAAGAGSEPPSRFLSKSSLSSRPVVVALWSSAPGLPAALASLDGPLSPSSFTARTWTVYST